MLTKYFCIVDDLSSAVAKTVKRLNSKTNELVVEVYERKQWDKQLDFIIENQDEIDGLIFSELSCKNNQTGRLDFSVDALVKQIRIFARRERKIIRKNFPIVLCLSEDILENKKTNSFRSYGIFDEIYKTSDLEKSKKVAKDLIVFSKGYEIIRKKVLELNC